MINTVGVTKTFGKLTALHKVTLDLNKGETISLTGSNGSGKTTFIKCLLGMVIPDSGTILFNNENIANRWQYRQYLGYMPQMARYPQNMSVGQVIDMLLDLRRAYMAEIDEELITSFGLKNILHRRMGVLSGGTRQKVSAALTFLFNPIVLILDEPTAGLDPLASEILKEKIRKEKEKGKLILITSHILSDLDDLVSQVIYLQDGHVIFHQSLSDLRANTGEEKLSRAIAMVMKTHNQPA